MTLTLKQIEAYHFIRHYILQNNVAPTEREIADAVSIRSRGVVHRYVRALEKAGYLKLIPNKKRNILLVPEKTLSCSKLPIVGKIAAGAPIQQTSKASLFDYSKLLLSPEHFVLEVTDDSMRAHYIQAGDYLVCERCTTVPHGLLAVVLVDGVITLRYVQYNDDNTFTLFVSDSQQDRESFSEQKASIQGVYRGLIRMDALSQKSK